jgi:UDP-glucose 4-epimerase
MEHLKAVENHPKLEIRRGSVIVEQAVRNAFQGCQVVIHLAVLGLRQSLKQPHVVNEVISGGTLTCLEAARAQRVERFVNCSSSEVYGSAVYTPMDEAHPLLPETPYAASKVAQDMLVRSYGRTHEVPWVTLRPFNMYGPNSHWQGVRGELIPKMIVRALNREPLVVFGDGSQTRDFVYVEEVAHAMVEVAAEDRCLGRTINVCTGVETSVRQIAGSICAKLGLDPTTAVKYETARPGDVARHVGDNTQFAKLFGRVPEVTMDEGLSRTLAWIKSLPDPPELLLSQELKRNWE